MGLCCDVCTWSDYSAELGRFPVPLTKCLLLFSSLYNRILVRGSQNNICLLETPWCSVLLYNPRNCMRVLVLTSFINLRIFILLAHHFSIIGAISDKPHSVHLECNGVFIDLGPACVCTSWKKSLMVIRLGWVLLLLFPNLIYIYFTFFRNRIPIIFGGLMEFEEGSRH